MEPGGAVMTDGVHAPFDLARIADSICLCRQRLPSQTALARARVSIAWTIAQILSGIDQLVVERLLDAKGLTADSGPALILGTSRRTSVLDAAFVNGAASRAARPSIAGTELSRQIAPIVALLLSIGEVRAVAGESFLRAYLIGAVTASALRRANLGDADNAVSLVVPAVAAASHILALDARQLFTAIELALRLVADKDSSLAAGEFAPIYAGYCVLTALFAAQFAESAPAESGSRAGEKTHAGPEGFEAVAQALPSASFDELWTEFDDIARCRLPRDQIAPLFDLLDNVGSVSNIGKLTRLLEAKVKPDGARAIIFAKAGEHDAPETTWVP